jgi:spore coat protein CotH
MWGIMIRVFVCCLLICKFTTLQADNDVIKKIESINLPVIHIETVNGEMPTYKRAETPDGCWGMGIKNITKVPGRLFMTLRDSIIYDTGNYVEDVSGMTIRVRGNSSAVAFDKKPYKIKLQKKYDLLMRGDEEKYKDKEWVLLKDEKSTIFKQINNKVSKILDLQWTPEIQYVNVVFNGEYWGMYELCESVKRNTSCRLNVDDSGYIFEYDLFWWNEDLYVKSPTPLSDPWPMNYTFKYPDSKDITNDQLGYFKSMIAKTERSLIDGDYQEFIDIDSFVSWILAHDLLGNHDDKGSNIFLTKLDSTENSKVMMGNLWDMDRIFEMEGEWDPSHNMFFYKKLFNSKNKAFVKAYKDKWNQLSTKLTDDLMTYLDEFANSELAEAIDKSTKLDNRRWDTDFESTSYYVNKAKKWLTSRKEWLDRKINKLDTGDSTNIMSHEDNQLNNSSASYFNLRGQKVDQPIGKGIYIKNGKKIIITNIHH